MRIQRNVWQKAWHPHYSFAVSVRPCTKPPCALVDLTMLALRCSSGICTTSTTSTTRSTRCRRSRAWPSTPWTAASRRRPTWRRCSSSLRTRSPSSCSYSRRACGPPTSTTASTARSACFPVRHVLGTQCHTLTLCAVCLRGLGSRAVGQQELPRLISLLDTAPPPFASIVRVCRCPFAASKRMECRL